MDNEMNSTEDIETPSLDYKVTDEKDNYEPEEAGQDTFELDIENIKDNLSGSYYLPVYEEELIDEPVLSEFEEDPLELKSDVKKEETDEELLIVEPVLTVFFDDDPLEFKSDVEKEETDEELTGSGGYGLGEDIMERVHCEFCKEYSYVTKSSFLYKLQSFCDKCYHNHLKKYKDGWMNVMYELYESCLVCMSLFCNSLDMVKHDCTCKNYYYCNSCSLIVIKKEDIERHVKMCVSESSSLDNRATTKSICGTTSLTRTSSSKCHLTKHKSYIVRRKGEFFDNIKKKNSSTSSYQKNKLSHIIKSYKCNYCDKHFCSPSNLKIHLCIHTFEKLFPCKICKKSFTKPSRLEIHLRTHTGEKPFPCEFCKKSFSESGSLKRHLRTHTGEKPFLCQVCEKSFSQACILKKHLRTHTGEKPFPCNLCKKSFSESGHLKSHLRTHSGEKPFSCKLCKKSFSENSSLKRHLRTHTGEKPFSCQFCKKLFSESRSLNRHLRTHSGEEQFSWSHISAEEGHFLDLRV